jgi:cell wall-associated NlpC family hydrolase
VRPIAPTGDIRWRVVAAALGFLAGGPSVDLSAQGITAEVGHLFEEGPGEWTTYRLGIERSIVRPVNLALYGTHLRDQSPTGRRHWGAGADVVLLRGRTSGPYLAAGLAGGLSSDSLDDWWHSWSAGGGYQLVVGGAIALGGEARWRSVSPGGRDGLELAVRLGALLGGAGHRARAGLEPRSPLGDLPPAPGERPALTQPNPPPDSAVLRRPAPRRPPALATVAPAESRAASRLGLADSVVATALEALGTSYRLGGTTGAGFDCSGLIQHAYARHGIPLPRVSRDQAKEGEAVKRELDALRPGDILTFSRRGGRITHVGLYLGDGRFVHSARRGVQVSALSDTDPQGRWYWKRWVGARRIVASAE